MDDLQTYKQTWLEIVISQPNETAKGNAFLEKFISDWLDPSPAMLDDSIYCDGANDGGIDFAMLINGDDCDESSDSDDPLGNTWHIIQAKYGESFSGTNTLIIEANKFFRTIRGDNDKLSEGTKRLVNKLQSFIVSNDTGRDKLVLTFALVDDLTESESREITKIRDLGRGIIAKTFNVDGAIFDVCAISIDTIFHRNIDELAFNVDVALNGNLKNVNNTMLVGSASILDFYDFLLKYRQKTNDLDRIFEKNVRKSLGGTVKVNKGIRRTLESNPEQFGLFNNGITIAVKDFLNQGEVWLLSDPYIVNGCQTTSSIWSVCDSKLFSGSSTKAQKESEWENRLKSSHVIIKIVKIGDGGDDLLQSITRYTNSQNAVRDKDFIALSNSFQDWREKFKSRWKIFLEIQKGGWDAEKSKNFGIKGGLKYLDHVNAVDLMKAYGAGWLKIPGVAYGKNAPFVPGGSVYNKVTSGEIEFDEIDLHAAYILLKAADNNGFNRQSKSDSRKQTRYLYCFLVVYLLRSALESNNFNYSNHRLSELIHRHNKIHEHLTEGSCEIIDEYMSQNGEYSIDKEPNWNRSINYYLKSEHFGKDLLQSENLKDLLSNKIREYRRNNYLKDIANDMNH